MAIYLKKFENHTQYDNYINGSGAILPNVSICTAEGDVHYNPYVEPIETRLVCKYNVTDTSNPTKIGYNQYISGFSAIEIDGVEQAEVVSAYTFSTTGEHTVKYTLTDPTTIIRNAFFKCSDLTSIDIPIGITSIGIYAFQDCSGLTSIDIPIGVTSIGENAFYRCSGLTSVTIPDSVTTIDIQAFSDCKNIKMLNSNVDGVFNIPSSVTSIGGAAFNQCNHIENLTMPNVTTIGRDAFAGCFRLIRLNSNVDGVYNLVNVINIGAHAFNSCNLLTKAILSDNIEIINGFSSCISLTSIGGIGSNTSIEIPNNATSIGDMAFQYSYGITSVVIPDNITSIDSNAFSRCSGLTSVTIGSGVTSIGNSAFTYCSGMTSVTIGGGVTSIGKYAFYECRNLINITVEATTPPVLGTYAFSATGSFPIYVPSGSVDTYKAASGWSVYASRIQAIP